MPIKQRQGVFDVESFSELIADPMTPNWLIRHFLEEDVLNSKPFAPALKSREDLLERQTIEILGGMEYFNRIDHEKRLKKYQRMIERGYSGPKIVSEGDSWFLYPVLLDDVVDHLYDKYAVYSLGASGDDLDRMIAQDQFIKAIFDEDADIFLLSAGGNNIIGDIAANVHRFDPSFVALDYPNNAFRQTLQRLEGLFRSIFERVIRETPKVKTYFHGYDYVIPRKNGPWLGRPMREKRGIEDSQLQREITDVLMNQFNECLAGVASEFAPKVTFVDCRGSVPTKKDWFNEIHPRSHGFGEASSRFVKAIELI